MTTAAIQQSGQARRLTASPRRSAAVAIPPSEFVKSLADADRDEWFAAFCERNADRDQYEISNSGELLIMPPTGHPGSLHEVGPIAALYAWAQSHGGFVHGPTARFVLPDGSRLGPDAAWVCEELRSELMAEHNRPFPHIVPDFIVEVQSPSNSREELIDKINLFNAHGTRLGWLIDADGRTVVKLRPGREPEELHDPEFVDGDEDVLPGFRFAVRAQIFDHFTDPG